MLVRVVGDVREQDRRDALALPFVGYQECNLGTLPVDPHVTRVGDHHRRRSTDRDQPVAVGVVDLQSPVGGPLEVGGAKETKHDRLTRDSEQKPVDRIAVAVADRAHVDRRPVVQNDVGFTIRRVSDARRVCRHAAESAACRPHRGWFTNRYAGAERP